MRRWYKKNLIEELNSELDKYFRRPDLTPEIRMLIAYEAYTAQKNKIHGAIIQLAQNYNICRQFVYILLQKFIELLPLVFSTSKEIEKLNKKEVIKTILSYRFEGGMSIAAISTVMKRQGLDYSGKSTISQSLSAIGALLPSIESIPVDKDFKITALPKFKFEVQFLSWKIITYLS